MVARSLSELVQVVDVHGEAWLEYRGRSVFADRAGLRITFQMSDGLEGSVGAGWPSAAAASEDGRAGLLRALNGLVQRCSMFEVCERAYQIGYGRPQT